MSTEVDNDTYDKDLFWGYIPLVTQKELDQRIAGALPTFLPQDPAKNFLLTKNIQILSDSIDISVPSFTHQIAMICGINTSPEEARAHCDYLNSFFPEGTIDVIPNKSHGALLDLTETLFFNYLGISIHTAKALRSSWSQFHKKNRDNPDIKILQFCHSQGTIHVRNALLRTPKEIRDRLIVVAISPGTIVPKELCFTSFNYASKRDPIPWAELLFITGRNITESGAAERIIENHKQLILLDPHPDANLIDHDFQSPTFKEKIQYHIEDYIDKMGQYPDELLC